MTLRVLPPLKLPPSVSDSEKPKAVFTSRIFSNSIRFTSSHAYGSAPAAQLEKFQQTLIQVMRLTPFKTQDIPVVEETLKKLEASLSPSVKGMLFWEYGNVLVEKYQKDKNPILFQTISDSYKLAIECGNQAEDPMISALAAYNFGTLLEMRDDSTDLVVAFTIYSQMLERGNLNPEMKKGFETALLRVIQKRQAKRTS